MKKINKAASAVENFGLGIAQGAYEIMTISAVVGLIGSLIAFSGFGVRQLTRPK